MMKHEDFNIGCPKCGCVVFDKVKGTVVRSIHSERVGKRFLYKLDLIRCSGCGVLLFLLEDSLELVEITSKETDNADKP